MPQDPKTLTITELGGPLTRRNDGDINSGLAKYDTSWGYDPYSKPGNLTWMEQPVSILSLAGANSVIGIMKTRVESNQGFVYAVSNGAGGRLRRIQVNDTTTNNPNFDTHSVMGSMPVTINQDRVPGMVFYGSTEKIFYGDNDTSLSKINFDGSSPSTIALASSVISGVPRPMVVFLGRIYFGNGNNIGEIDSTELITDGSKLSPALPVGVFVKDLDVTPDGNYLQITASKSAPVGFAEDPVAGGGVSTESYKFLWNGIDEAVTYFEEYGGTNLTAGQTFGDKNYALGSEPFGTAIFSQQNKIVTLPNVTSPHPTATFSIGNVLGFMSPEYVDGELRGSLFHYGQFDSDSPSGLFRILRHESTVKTDVPIVNAVANVSNLFYFPSYSSYTNDTATVGKIYFTTKEASANANADSRSILWRFTTVPTGVGSIVAGTYETQTQLFSKKVKISEVSVYTEPLIGGNDFIVDVIGSGGSVMAGGSQRFQVATGSVVTGTDMVHFNPAMAPTYACGVRITNSSVTGVANWTGTKIEIDYEPAGR